MIVTAVLICELKVTNDYSVNAVALVQGQSASGPAARQVNG